MNPTDPDMPYLVRAEIRAFVDEKKFTFASYGCCLSNTFGYHDMEELLDYANAPIIKRDSDVVLAIVDSRRKVAYKPIILHTRNRVDPNCQVPLGFTDEDNDATEYIRPPDAVNGNIEEDTMKNIEVTYDALICENGTYEQGEAAFILPMTDELAAEYLAGRATDRGAVNLVETALEAVEVMRGRVYVRGSIKAYCEAK